MDRTWTLVSYKLRFFFGPAFRGRFGLLLYLGLVLVFVPTGFAAGMGIGNVLADSSPQAAVNVLALPLAGILSLALLYSLGAGVTAHPSEFDFLMTAEIRPREYLTADLLFQFVSVMVAGGLALVVAALAILATMGQPLVTALPLLALLGSYGALILMTSQVLVIARVRHPKAPVRLLTLGLIAFSLLPGISLAQPDFPLRFDLLPYPSTVFASVATAVLTGGPVDGVALGIALVYAGLILFTWTLASDAYIFHAIRPTLSAGFGQVDMSFRMDQQRRMIGSMGGLTTRVRLRTERGGETGLMARLHLIRIWRDGSILFVLLFGAIASAPVLLGGADAASTSTISVTQVITLLLGILAMNWSYYERANLWLLVVSGRSVGAYFRGLLASLAAIGLFVAAVFLGLLMTASASRLPLRDIALPVAAPVGAALGAALVLTRIRLKPAAFSPAVLGLLFVVAVAGFLGGLGAQGVLASGAMAWGLGEAVQAAILAFYTLLLSVVGMWFVSRLAAGFRL